MVGIIGHASSCDRHAQGKGCGGPYSFESKHGVHAPQPDRGGQRLIEPVERGHVRHDDPQQEVVVPGEPIDVAYRLKALDGGKETRTPLRCVLKGFDTDAARAMLAQSQPSSTSQVALPALTPLTASGSTPTGG